MPTEKKAKVIDELQELISRSSVGILTDYRGLSTAELNDLRRKLRDAGIRYRVVKNSLAYAAARGAGREEIAGTFEGPVAIALGFDDEVKPAKILADYIKATKSTLSIKGGFLSGRVLTPSDVENLATIPPREILIGKLMAGVQSPLYRLVNALVSPLRGLTGVLQARINQLEET